MANELLNVDEDVLLKNVISVCNEEHLRMCDCQKDKVNKAKQELMKNVYEELQNSGDIDDEAIVKHRMKLAFNQAISQVQEFCIQNNIRCPYEKQLLRDTLDRFKNLDAYDLNDPKVYLILKSVLSHQLSAYRMQVYSNYLGMINETHDDLGNTTYVLNPVEEAKRKADDSIIKAVEKLVNMTEGQKLKTINESRVTVKFEDLLNEKDNRYVNLQEPIKFKFDNTPPVMKEQKDNS